MTFAEQPAVALTRELVRIDSSDPGAFEGNIGDYIYQWLLANTDAEVDKDEVLPGRFNVRARLKGNSSRPPLVYICHMDTVTLGEGWSLPPLEGRIMDDKLYGRGACDMKSGLACALLAFRAISEAAGRRELERPFVFIGSVDEEDFMRGVERAVKKGWVTGEDLVLDTEPTGGQIQVAHKGRTWFELTAKGITAHASTPWKGADAIAAMAEMIVSIRNQIADCPFDEDLGCSTVTFGQIKGGYRPYVVPDSCTVSIDMRLAPPTDTQRAAAIVEAAIARAEQQVPGVTGAYRITGDRPYIEKDPCSFLLHALKDACDSVTGRPTHISYFPGYTDTAVISGLTGNHNCMSYGPGSLELAHKPDEWVACEDILRCEKVLCLLARTLTLPLI